MRSPSRLSDSSVRPSFLRITPAKKPRTECCCHPVACMIAAIVAPLGWLSNAITSACLEFGRVVEADLVVAATFCRRPGGFLDLVLRLLLVFGISNAPLVGCEI